MKKTNLKYNLSKQSEEPIKSYKELLAEEAGIEIPSPKKENSEKKQDNTVLALDVEGAVDVLDDGSKFVFLTEEGETVDFIEKDGVKYTPPPKDKFPYLLPSKENVLKLINDNSDGSDAVIYTRLLTYHKEISELPNELFYHLLVLWDIHTYFLDRLHFSPILYLYAVRERGKSRTGKGCIYVSRRGIFTETVREPDIIRWGNDHKAAIGFDVKDFPKKLERANCDDLLLARFEKGSVSSRTLWPERGAFKDTKNFSLYGPTIVMTNRPVDDILESRSISIDMKPSKKEFENEVLPETALELKELLTAFRFKHLNTTIKKINKPCKGRLGDILSVLNNLVETFFPDKRGTFNELVKIIVSQKRDEATDTFEAQVVSAIINSEPNVKDGFIAVEDITSIFNGDKDEKFAVRTETIGRILKGLGFSPRRTTGGKRGIYYDTELIQTLIGQYGLNDLLSVSQTASLPSLTSLPSSDNDKSDSSDTVIDTPEVDFEEILEQKP